MTREVVITGLGTVTAAGIGIDPLWEAVCEGRSLLARIERFDPAGFDLQIGSEVRDLKVNKIVPKSYRKATKVMARDIELAVAAADAAVTSANLVTKQLDDTVTTTYHGERTGCHIGAGLIEAEREELTLAMVEARDGEGRFDLHAWGSEGMGHLTPLWLLKYLPNMLASHVTIIHDARGPSNTITCAEASSGLSIGESMRVIGRGDADLCFSGGADSKFNLLTLQKQISFGRANTQDNDNPATAVRAFDDSASGTVFGEAGGVLTLEAKQTADERGANAFARLSGFGASQSINRTGDPLDVDSTADGMTRAMRKAIADAGLEPSDIDAIVANGSAVPQNDRAEAAAIKAVFGDGAGEVPIWSSKPYIGLCGAGAGGIDVAIAAKMLAEQKIPATINCDSPIEQMNAGSAPARDAVLNHVLVCATALGGQNVAHVLSKA